MHPIIHESSITGIFRLLLIVVTVYAVYSLFIRYIIPSLMKKYVEDFQKRFTQENQHFQDEQNRKKEGEISIKFVEKDKNSTKQPDDSEYVDYEEIK